jgi:D-glycero-D-manno-heptose 1,7-bisphosphate phosphatase
MVKKKSAIFLDRDGVLNIPIIIKKKTYAPTNIRKFRLYPNVKRLCKRLKKKYLLIVITNQPDIKNGKLKIEQLKLMHVKLKNEINYDELYFCSSMSKNSFYRKPNPGMLLKAVKKFNIHIENSYLIGDRWSDIEAGKKIGCKTIFINRDYYEKKPQSPDFVVRSFSQAVQKII